MQTFINFFKPAFFPFSILFFCGIYFCLYKLFDLPNPSETIQIFIKWFELYGFLFLFFAAFFEAIFVIGIYFPGSLAIVLAVLTLGTSLQNFVLIGLISFSAFLLASVVNFYLGKLGYYKLLKFAGQEKIINQIEDDINKSAFLTFFLAGIYPNFIAIACVCAGIGKMPFAKMFRLVGISLLFWVSIWTLLSSFVVDKLSFEDNNQFLYLLGLIFIWGIILIIKDTHKQQASKNV